MNTDHASARSRLRHPKPNAGLAARALSYAGRKSMIDVPVSSALIRVNPRQSVLGWSLQ
jgi:hypothetical protein